MKKEKGSLTVEAVISFTVFLMVTFLMLHLVKLTMISLTLHNATAETAKQIATAAYPITWANALQTKGEAKADEVIEDPLSTLLGEENSRAAQMLGATPGGADLVKVISDYIGEGEDGLFKIFYNLKGKVAQKIAANILNGYLETSGIAFNKDNVRFRIVKLPQTDKEFELTDSYTLAGKKNNLVIQKASAKDAKDNCFNQDDIVICTEYDYELALPMLPKIELTLRSVAIEHGWLTGCLIKTERKEGLGESELFDDKVYVATGGYGKCFHRKDCRMINLSSGYDASGKNRSIAVKEGLRPCKVCNP